MRILAALGLSILMTPALAQRIPNLGEKVCALWTATREEARVTGHQGQFPMAFEWWLMGYLKGMSNQYAYANKVPNPLIKLQEGEELLWMDAYCRVNKTKDMSDGALALLVELINRR